uniref:CUB and zona pellucida-like domain-containing protein 1 n=1 Tax=Accipiter nisus TaxID=211598 RepID=A0A8B9NEP1_9AVES
GRLSEKLCPMGNFLLFCLLELLWSSACYFCIRKQILENSIPFLSAAPYFCGGSFSNSSGMLQSPFYPRSYPNNADCMWEIQVENNFRVMLTFRDIAHRCRYDYVEVYDGPPHSSPLLGRLCSGSFPTYISSSNMMTVRFHSDSRYTFRGFQAYYSSIAADHNTTLLCLPDYMHAVVSRDYLQSQGYSAQMVTLNDSHCKPRITSREVIFNIPYNSCGTIRENNDTINYSNMIKITSSGYIIKRKKNIHLHISCKMLQNTRMQIMYVAEDTIDVNEIQFGRYDMNITFYDSSSFLWQVHDSPYYIELNQDLYLQAYLHSSDPNLIVFVDTCVASPDRHDFNTLAYDIIKDGCVRDSSYTTYHSPYSHFARFKFNAFEFIRRHTLVYLQCELAVCRLGDYSSRCYRGCINRSKRDTRSVEEEVKVVVGPLRLREGDLFATIILLFFSSLILLLHPSKTIYPMPRNFVSWRENMSEVSINISRLIKREEDLIWGEVIGHVWKGNVKTDLAMAFGVVAI